MNKKLIQFGFLDCTLRDGGYYSNWDFSPKVLINYFKAMDSLPIDFIEIGYRNIKHERYHGEFFYTPINTINKIKKITTKPLVIILNEKDLTIDQIKALIEPCIGKIRMIRLAVDPDNLDQAKLKASVIKSMGFEVALNIMYLSHWINDFKFHKKLKKIEEFTDYLYLVDSFGAVFPTELKMSIRTIKKLTNVKLGFHGHNNLELAFANTIISIEEGIDIVDATIMGMGRGSGNLKTELLLSIMSKKRDINFDILSKTLEDFQKLKNHYKWETSLPYMIAGIHGIPQKKIMEWITTKFYNLSSVVKALNKNIFSNSSNTFPSFEFKGKADHTIIIGGGLSVLNHLEAIKNFIKHMDDIVLIFSSARHLKYFNEFENKMFICLIGNEDKRFEENKENLYSSNLKIVIPPSPREMGTYVPLGWDNSTMELNEIILTKDKIISHCSISLEIANQIGKGKNYLIGFDGYDSNSFSEKQNSVFIENQKVFDAAQENKINLTSLFPTKYSIKTINSIYSLIF